MEKLIKHGHGLGVKHLLYNNATLYEDKSHLKYAKI